MELNFCLFVSYFLSLGGGGETRKEGLLEFGENLKVGLNETWLVNYFTHFRQLYKLMQHENWKHFIGYSNQNTKQKIRDRHHLFIGLLLTLLLVTELSRWKVDLICLEFSAFSRCYL